LGRWNTDERKKKREAKEAAEVVEGEEKRAPG
jgi:hypothetical protein